MELYKYISESNNIRRGFNSKVNAKLDSLLGLIDEINSKGVDISLDNSTPNKYLLIVSDKQYQFFTYDDIYNCLEIILDIM